MLCTPDGNTQGHQKKIKHNKQDAHKNVTLSNLIFNSRFTEHTKGKGTDNDTAGSEEHRP